MADNNPLNEAAAVAYTQYKRKDGFEVCLTLRDQTGKDVMTRLEGAIKTIIEQGGTPLPIRGSFAGRPPKEKEYVEGRTCPTCGSKLVRATTKTGKRLIKCEKSGWNPTTKQPTGCPYMEWDNSGQGSAN